MCVISSSQLGVLCTIVHTFVPSSCRPTHTMNITPDKVGHIITDHKQHILYVHSSCHGIWADEKLNFAWSEISEDCLTLLWCQTRGVFGNFYSTIELHKKIQSVKNKKRFHFWFVVQSRQFRLSCVQVGNIQIKPCLVRTVCFSGQRNSTCLIWTPC